MKSSSTALMITGLCLIATLVAVHTFTHARRSSVETLNAGNAAFRDGAYQGRLAVQNGEKPRLTAARWQNDLDRQAYVAGYQQAYVQVSGQNGITVAQGIEQAGYRNGLEDGADDRQNAESFRNSTAQEVDNLGQSKEYRDAYSTGYQLAFYGEQEVNNALVIRPVSLRTY